MPDTVEKVHCDKCNALRTIIDHPEERVAVLDCGHTVQYNKDTQTWQN